MHQAGSCSPFSRFSRAEQSPAQFTVMSQQPVDQVPAQEEVKACSQGTEKNETLSDCHSSEAESVGAEDRRRNGRGIADQTQANMDPDQLDLSGRRKPALVRSKTFDHSLLSQIQPDSDSKIERKKSHYSQLSKTNSQYHKIFKDISKEELIRQSYTCAIQKDILYHGRLFVSDNWICFNSKVFGRDTKIAIPVVSVIYIKKTKTAILLPNALEIATANDRHIFVSFLSRDNTYKFLMSVCLHLEEKSPCSSPIPSSAESSFRAQRSPRSSRFPLGFPGDFSDMDGAVRQRRQNMEESSSSDSQTPDYDKIAEFPVPPFLDELKCSDSPLPSDHQTRQNLGQNLQNSESKPQETCYAGASNPGEVMVDNRTIKPVSLNALLFIYLFLVCVLVFSSCYMAFRIINLEQRLTTLGSMSDYAQHENEYLRGNPEVNAEIYSELTLNLMKLEKVQRNLQRLLEEAN